MDWVESRSIDIHIYTGIFIIYMSFCMCWNIYTYKNEDDSESENGNHWLHRSKKIFIVCDLTTAPIFMMVHGLFSHYQHSTHCHLLQVKNMPPSVIQRFGHSLNTIAVSQSCLWLMAVGGEKHYEEFASSCVLLKLSE